MVIRRGPGDDLRHSVQFPLNPTNYRSLELAERIPALAWETVHKTSALNSLFGSEYTVQWNALHLADRYLFVDVVEPLFQHLGHLSAAI